jgi:flagellar motor switch protein FliM
LRENILDAPARLHAVLHRTMMTVAEVEAFEVGQVVSLKGVTVGSVRLEGPRQRLLANVRLGQVSGLRAVRLEPAQEVDLGEVPIADAVRPAVAPPDRIPADAEQVMRETPDAGG